MISKGFKMIAWILIAWLVPGMGVAGEVQTTPSSSITVLICYPGGSVRTRDAQSGTDTMLRLVEEAGNWPPGSMTSLFTTNIKACETHLNEDNPQFSITTLSTFLAYREKLNLIPLVQPLINGSSSEKYRMLVRKGTVASLEGLREKSLGGALTGEPSFLGRVIFQGRVHPESYFVLKDSPRVLRSLKALVRGDLDAVMVNSRQYSALSSLPFADELQVAFTSEEVPLVGVVANGQRTTKDERNRFTQALSEMCNHKEGKQLCELFGLETFVPANAHAFKKVIDLWDTP